MSSKSPSILKTVVIAGILTLGVTGVRLYGELQGWDPRFFGTEAGGGYITKDAAGKVIKHMSFFGIAFLVPIFGFWFGARLSRGGNRPKSIGKALLILLLAMAVMVGSFFLITKVLTNPDDNSLEGIRQRMLMACGGTGLTALVALFAWPRLWVTNLAYALLARIPVVGITYVACERGWDTHHVKMGDTTAVVDPMVKAFWLSVPQLVMWPVFTIIVGGIFGILAAAVIKPRKA